MRERESQKNLCCRHKLMMMMMMMMMMMYAFIGKIKRKCFFRKHSWSSEAKDLVVNMSSSLVQNFILTFKSNDFLCMN